MNAIPDRNPSSPFFGREAATATPRLVALWVDTLKAALASADRADARAKLDYAVECYHELRARQLEPELLADIETAMGSAVREFPTAEHVFPSLDLLAKAKATSDPAAQMRLLAQAEAMLQAGLARPDTNHDAINDVMSQLGAAAGAPGAVLN